MARGRAQQLSRAESFLKIWSNSKILPQEIEDAIHTVYEEVKSYKTNARKELLKCLAWLIGGILGTVFSYQSAVSNGGGKYYIMYGAMNFGGVQAVRGILYYVKIRNAGAEKESELRTETA